MRNCVIQRRKSGAGRFGFSPFSRCVTLVVEHMWGFPANSVLLEVNRRLAERLAALWLHNNKSEDR